ncbi:MAG TPA: bacterial transcriptional activator domain-containing protein, partial [Burkholderiaceae bacterium]
GKFLAAVTALGRRLESYAAWPAAIALYERALAAEPLGEATYRGLMRCLTAQDDAGAAVSTYRRCAEVLLRETGRPVSAETAKLAAQLQLVSEAAP